MRDRFSNRLGFILISAGCAIGIGNVWRFPYIVGQYGGAAFVLIYLFFLVILGLPVMVMEYSVGRASQKSAALSFDVLEPKGTKWHFMKYVAMAGNYILMMFYTSVCGWLFYYFYKMLIGDFNGLNASQINVKSFCSSRNDVSSCMYWLFHLFKRFAEWCGKSIQVYDVVFIGVDAYISNTFTDFARGNGGCKVLLIA